MQDWKPYVLGLVALYFYYDLIRSIQKGQIIWKIFTFKKQEKHTSFWLACVAQFLLATIFLGLAIAYIFFYDQLVEFFIKIS